MESDCSETVRQVTSFGNSVTITLCTKDGRETHRIYDGLQRAKKSSCLWAELYGQFTDKFDINWAIIFFNINHE